MACFFNSLADDDNVHLSVSNRKKPHQSVKTSVCLNKTHLLNKIDSILVTLVKTNRYEYSSIIFDMPQLGFVMQVSVNKFSIIKDLIFYIFFKGFIFEFCLYVNNPPSNKQTNIHVLTLICLISGFHLHWCAVQPTSVQGLKNYK